MCHLRASVIIVTNQANRATLVAAGSQTGTTGGFVYVHVRACACVQTAYKHVQRQRRKTKTTDSAPDLLKNALKF